MLTQIQEPFAVHDVVRAPAKRGSHYGVESVPMMLIGSLGIASHVWISAELRELAQNVTMLTTIQPHFAAHGVGFLLSKRDSHYGADSVLPMLIGSLGIASYVWISMVLLASVGFANLTWGWLTASVNHAELRELA